MKLGEPPPSRTTANYESDDPDMLADVALATDCVIALIQQHCCHAAICC